MLVRNQIIADPQSGDVVIRNRRRAAQRAFRNIKLLYGPLTSAIAPAESIGISTGDKFGPSRNRPLTYDRYFSVSGTTSNKRATPFVCTARRASAGAISLKTTLACPRSYSFSAPRRRRDLFRRRPRRRCGRATSDAGDARSGGATIITTPCAMCDGSRLREIADIGPDHGKIGTAGGKCLGGIEHIAGIPTLSLTGESIVARRPAMIDAICLASPSNDPTAMVNVVGSSKTDTRRGPLPRRCRTRPPAGRREPRAAVRCERLSLVSGAEIDWSGDGLRRRCGPSGLWFEKP